MTKRKTTKAERSRSTAAAETVEALELLPLEYVQLIRDHVRSVSRIAAQRGELEDLTDDQRQRTALLRLTISNMFSMTTEHLSHTFYFTQGLTGQLQKRKAAEDHPDGTQ